MTEVVVAGATGMLGREIVTSLLQRGAQVRALVRPSSAKSDAARELVQQGATIVDRDVLGEPDRLWPALEGAEVVISALQGGQDVIVDGQIALLQAAEKAGVPRLIPSDFAVDLFRLDDGDNVFLDHRRRAHRAFVGSPVRVTSVLSGAFTEVMTGPFVEIVDWDRETFSYWGDGDESPCDFTTVADTAKYAAAVALDPETPGSPVRVAGDVLTMNEFHAALEHGSGRRLKVHRLGSVEDLADEIERRKAIATGPESYVALQYLWAMITGKAKLAPLENNRYSDIRPTTVTEFAGRFSH